MTSCISPIFRCTLHCVSAVTVKVTSSCFVFFLTDFWVCKYGLLKLKAKRNWKCNITFLPFHNILHARHTSAFSVKMKRIPSKGPNQGIALSSITVSVFVLYYSICVCTVSCLYYLTNGLLDLDAGRLARSQNPEGPATGHPDTGFSWFSWVLDANAGMVPNYLPSCHCMLPM
jgi:hypothetical protein